MLTSIGYTIALIVVSFINLNNVPKLGSGYDDKVYHICAYLILGFLWMVYVKPLAKKRLALKVILVTSLFGILIESLQHQLNPNRTFDILDIVANCIGAVIGTLIASRLYILKLK
ncbi:MAG: VanZ family protein [Winogradskyella sp.]|uniref:VanZ family protein n=1 Tax=Winogradskyella sp. TaxID=1883156 RepID=UPI001848FF42|nr:VanZ family protein [Winogradskyella sp.]